jgi:hypothetical protein
MSIQAIHRSEVLYLKAEQDCGLQGCLTSVCRLIIRFVRCFFETFCCCCCKPDSRPRRAVDLTPAQASFPCLDGKILPRELLVHIFCLCSCSGEMKVLQLLLVCKGWYGIVHDACKEQLKYKKSLTLREIFICESILGDRSRNNWKSIFIHCEQLEALNFSRALPPVSGRSTELVVEKHKTRISSVLSIIHVALEKSPKFNILDLSYCPGVESCSFISMILRELQCNEKFKRLTHLNLAFSCGKDFVDDLLVAQVCLLPNLVSLDLTGLVTQHENIVQIASSCPGLRRLKISSIGGFEDDAVSVLLKGCPALTHLSIGCLGISLIMDTGLQALAQYGKNLVFFHYHYRSFSNMLNDHNLHWEEMRYAEVQKTLQERLPNAQIFFTPDAHEDGSLAYNFFLDQPEEK